MADTYPCCFVISNNPFVWDCVTILATESNVAWCRSQYFGELGPYGLECRDDSQGGCYVCHPPDISGSCCFNESLWVENEFLSNCINCGGVPGVTAADCRPEPPEPTCRERQPSIPHPSGMAWSVDLFGNMAYGIGVSAFGSARQAAPISVTPMRTHDRADSEIPCQQTQTDIVVADDGYAYVMACSTTHVHVKHTSLAALGVSLGSDELDDGYSYWMGAIHLPWWTETVMGSHKLRCGIFR